jgi:predicted alpha/beta-fold hydrolase
LLSEEFVFPDGGTINLDWNFAKASTKEDGLNTPSHDNLPIMIVNPGQANSTNDMYIKNYMKKFSSAGYHVICIGHRGYQNINKFTSHLVISPARDSDPRNVIDYVHEKFCKDNSRKLFASGFSVGGCQLAKMIGIDKT